MRVTFFAKDMTYKEWKAKQDALYDEGAVDKARKITYNESADREQYADYKQMLGKNAPKTFDEFKEIKYGNDWNDFKAYAGAVKRGELTALADFELYKNRQKRKKSKI